MSKPLIEQASEAIINLSNLTEGFSTHQNIDPYSVLGYQSNLIRIHMELGLEMARKFGAKETAYLERKIMHAKSYMYGREKLGMKVGDAGEAANRDVEVHQKKEIDTAAEYEAYRTMLHSLQQAFEYARSVVSFLKTAESSYTPEDETGQR